VVDSFTTGKEREIKNEKEHRNMDNGMNWISEYNKLFRAINDQNSPNYFSGNRFIMIIKEFDPDFADYTQFIEYRNKEKLSTSRKDYFYDILMMYPEDIRKKIINRIWEEIMTESAVSKETNLRKKETIPSIVDIPEIEKQEPKVTTEVISNPTVFISYSWDNEEHKNWVLKLAAKLIDKGVNVLIDRYDLNPGSNKFHFMEISIKKADKVIIVFSKNYKLKAENRNGGIGYEYSILNSELYKNIANNNKFLPIIRNGSNDESIPEFMQQFIFIDMIDDSKFDEKFNQLLLAIYDKPQIDKPKLGQKPIFKYW
jgi:hypothetical protein